jgi:transcriptional regulator with XRE-family HTH domain
MELFVNGYIPPVNVDFRSHSGYYWNIMKTNNVKFIRLRRNITIDRLVEVTGIPKTTLHRIENDGSEKVLNKYRDVLATALNCAPADLDATQMEEGIPVVGEVKFKSYVKMLPQAKWKEAEYVKGLPETAQAVRIVGNHLAPAHGRNDILYFDSEPETNPSLFIEKQCLVQIPKGNLMIAWVTAGSKPDHFFLHQYGSTQVLTDQKIVKAHPILHVQRG